jgi:hypothetical protein
MFGLTSSARVPLVFTAIAALHVACVAAPSSEFNYQARQGDTLIGLGQTLLERPADWPVLARLNRIHNPRRIPIGSSLRIPVALLKARSVPGTVVNSVGSSTLSAVGAPPVPLQAGTSIAPGMEIRTGPQSYVTLQLADGSVLRLQPSSVVQLERSKHYEAAGFFASKLKLLKGRIEALVAHLTGGEPRFEIQTPQAVMGVRGTEFRTTVSPDQGQTQGEVLQGAVAVGIGRAAPAGMPVMLAGYGTRIDAGTRAPQIIKLLPPPDVSTLPSLHERLLVRLPLPAVPGAAQYRAQVARDADFHEVLAEATSASSELRIADLPDGRYHLRLRAIDAQGLEGLNADTTLRLKARPEPPILTQPAPRGKLRSDQVTLGWAEQAQAATYRLQLISETDPAAFAKPLHEQTSVSAAQWTLALPPGDYRWRVASIQANGDQGPWGDATSFSLRAPPAQPAPPRIDDKTMHFSWTGEDGQRFEFQIARDPAFVHLLRTLPTAQAQVDVDKPLSGGRLYVRYRAIDADGFVGPYTSPQIIELPACAQDGHGECIQTGQAGILSSR